MQRSSATSEAAIEIRTPYPLIAARTRGWLDVGDDHPHGKFALRTISIEREVKLPAGSLRIPLDEPFGRGAAGMLKPASSGTTFGYPAHRRLLRPGEPLPYSV